jgi:DNA polymerase-3 subunit gamma/tau
MENFIVSARKYRPMDFKSVIGQQSITTTLKSSIKNNHLAHAYLFTGPRGVGKTTCARIFSKTINCNNRTSEFEACNECESCKSFNENRSYNIHELDAASNNSVEDIRSLIEQVRIPPQIGTHSVYIIDEVHMLSTQAFNAFLKTLEEPPEYAIFVLATTEKHKIIPTILSRCQIFDFNRIKVEDSVKYLTYVAGKEGIEAETDALNIISQKADGAMRDALSFFDQIVSFAGNKITYQDAIDNLNVLDYDYYFKLTDYFLKNEYTNTLLTFNEILDNGFDGNHFITGLSSHFRDLLVCKNPETVELIEVGENIKQKYLLQSAKCSVDFLLRAMDISNNCDLSYRDSKNKRLLVELSMLKICNISKAIEKKANSAEIAKPVEQKSNVAEKSVANSVVKNVVSEEKQVSKPAEVKTEKTLGSGISLKKPIVPANENAEKSKLSENTTNTGVATQEEMIKAWEIMLESIKSTPRMYNTLKGKNPVTEGNNLFTVDVNGQLLLDALETRKGKLVESLRNILKKNIELKFVLSDEIPESLSKQPYTDKEKYNHLKDKNENLEKFRDTFGLDF